MRKFFLALGVLAALVIVGGGIALGILWRNGTALDTEAQAYVDDTVIAVSSQWSKDELLKRASPELLAILKAKPQDLDALFHAATIGLGPLVDYRGAKGEATIATMIGQGTIVTAHYVARAHFQKGDATIRLMLKKIDGQWALHGFYIDSSTMMNNLVGRSS